MFLFAECRAEEERMLAFVSVDSSDVAWEDIVGVPLEGDIVVLLIMRIVLVKSVEVKLDSVRH
jgi:hypothetical protein